MHTIIVALAGIALTSIAKPIAAFRAGDVASFDIIARRARRAGSIARVVVTGSYYLRGCPMPVKYVATDASALQAYLYKAFNRTDGYGTIRVTLEVGRYEVRHDNAGCSYDALDSDGVSVPMDWRVVADKRDAHAFSNVRHIVLTTPDTTYRYLTCFLKQAQTQARSERARHGDAVTLRFCTP
jgi:hypothetical protein